MKLFSANLSPFCAKVRIICYAKRLEIEIIPPPGGGPRAKEYLAINPLGKIPALLLDDGTLIPESDPIVEYLEDAFPNPSFRPSAAKDLALARAIVRVMELYVFGSAIPLLDQLDLSNRNQSVVDRALQNVEGGLRSLEHFIGRGGFAVGESFSIADASAAPMLFMVTSIGKALGKGDILANQNIIGQYFGRMKKDERFIPVMREMEARARDFFKQ